MMINFFELNLKVFRVYFFSFSSSIYMFLIPELKSKLGFVLG